MKMSREKFHQHECDVADILGNCCETNEIITLRTFFGGLNIFKQNFEDLKTFLKSIENSNATVFDFDFSKMNNFSKNKAFLHVVDASSTGNLHGELLSVVKTKMLSKCCICTLVLYAIFNYSKFGIALAEESRELFIKFVMKHFIISEVNCSSLHSIHLDSNDVSYQDIGGGIFSFYSKFNHSCVNNISCFDSDSKYHLIVERPIKAGEQLFVNYG